MVSITIPKKLAQEGELVVVPRKEYERLLELKKIREFTPTLPQKKALLKAESNLRKRKTFSYNELIRKLGFTD